MFKSESIILILVVLIALKLFFPTLISTFGAPIRISGTGKEPKEMWNLKNDMACTVGPGAKADFYSRSDRPGGVCNAQEFVNNQQEKYSILD